MRKRKIYWSHCGFRRGHLSMNITLDKSAYCCGELLQFKSHLHNGTTKNSYFGIQLIQQTKYKCEDKLKYLMRRVTKDLSPKISPGAIIDISSSSLKINIPVIPPTLQVICRIIELTYTLRFSLALENCLNEAYVEAPIDIMSAPIAYANVAKPKVYYDICSAQVEGGNYVAPEMMVGQVYDGTRASLSVNKTVKAFATNYFDSSKYSFDLTNKPVLVKGPLETDKNVIYRPIYATMLYPLATLASKKSIDICSFLSLQASPVELNPAKTTGIKNTLSSFSFNIRGGGGANGIEGLLPHAVKLAKRTPTTYELFHGIDEDAEGEENESEDEDSFDIDSPRARAKQGFGRYWKGMNNTFKNSRKESLSLTSLPQLNVMDRMKRMTKLMSRKGNVTPTTTTTTALNNRTNKDDNKADKNLKIDREHYI